MLIKLYGVCKTLSIRFTKKVKLAILGYITKLWNIRKLYSVIQDNVIIKKKKCNTKLGRILMLVEKEDKRKKKETL